MNKEPYQTFAVYLNRGECKEFLGIQRAPTIRQARARYAEKMRFTLSSSLMSNLELGPATAEEIARACTRCGRSANLKGAKPCPDCRPQQPRRA